MCRYKNTIRILMISSYTYPGVGVSLSVVALLRRGYCNTRTTTLLTASLPLDYATIQMPHFAAIDTHPRLTLVHSCLRLHGTMSVIAFRSVVEIQDFQDSAV